MLGKIFFLLLLLLLCLDINDSKLVIQKNTGGGPGGGGGGGNMSPKPSSVSTTRGSMETTSKSTTSTKGSSDTTTRQPTTTKGSDTTKVTEKPKNNSTGTVSTTSSPKTTGNVFTTKDGDDDDEDDDDDSYIDRTCEKDDEPDGCSLLLRAEIKTVYSIATKEDIYSIVKEAWRTLADSGYDTTVIALYVEFLKFVSYARDGDSKDSSRRLADVGTTVTSKSPEATKEDTTKTTGVDDGDRTTDVKVTEIEVSSTKEEEQGRTTGSNEVKTTGTNSGSDKTTEETSTKTTSNTVATTTIDYNYVYNFSIALFASDCNNIKLWYNFFVSYGTRFITYYKDYLEEDSKEYTTNGFGSIAIVQVTLEERDESGKVLASTTFVTSPANNFVTKNVIIFVSTLIIICLSLL